MDKVLGEPVAVAKESDLDNLAPKVVVKFGFVDDSFVDKSEASGLEVVVVSEEVKLIPDNGLTSSFEYESSA